MIPCYTDYSVTMEFEHPTLPKISQVETIIGVNYFGRAGWGRAGQILLDKLKLKYNLAGYTRTKYIVHEIGR